MGKRGFVDSIIGDSLMMFLSLDETSVVLFEFYLADSRSECNRVLICTVVVAGIGLVWVTYRSVCMGGWSRDREIYVDK